MLDDNTVKRMEKIIEEHRFFRDVPGLAVGIVHKDHMVYGKGFGFEDSIKKIPMRADALFHMASISKIFTATAVMQLAEKGYLNIDLPILTYLPELCVPAHESYLMDTTTRQMLSHTSGLPDCQDYGWNHPRFDDDALRDYVLEQQNLKRLAVPGSHFFYSNIAYEILGYLIECVSGELFENYCKKHIFEPAGMKLSDFRKSFVDRNQLVQPHIKDSENRVRISPVFPYNRAHAPSSTLYSNIYELGHFSVLMMNTLKKGDTTVLHPATLNQMLSPQAVIKKDEEIGLGWFISRYMGNAFYGHEGHDIGFRTTFAMIPEASLAFIVLANIENASTRKIMRMLFDLLNDNE
jgi:CubicO group peptidase (beta-lactamase class C family)